MIYPVNKISFISGTSLSFLLLTLIAVEFYGLVPLDLGKLLCLFLVPVLLFVSIKYVVRKSRNCYERVIKLMMLSLLLSYVNAWLFWGQDPILSLRVTYSSFFILIFYYLIKKKISIEYLESYIIFWGIVYICVWGLLMLINPTLLMAEYLQDDMSRGMLRLTLSGSCLLYLAYFLALNKWWNTKKNSYLLLTLVLFAGMFCQLTRQLIVFSLIITVLYFGSRKIKYTILCLIIGISAFALLKNVDPDNISFVPLQAMVQLTIKQAEENDTEENIREVEYKTFFTEISPNLITAFFGNSYPHYHSRFGVLEKRYKDREMYIVDVGYAMIYVTIGILGLFLYFWLFWHCIYVKMPEDCMYPKLFMGFLALYTIGTYYYSTSDGQIAIAICLYIIAQRKQLTYK